MVTKLVKEFDQYTLSCQKALDLIWRSCAYKNLQRVCYKVCPLFPTIFWHSSPFLDKCFYREEIKVQPPLPPPPPNYLVVHLGSNDLGIMPVAQLFQSFIQSPKYVYCLVWHVAPLVHVLAHAKFAARDHSIRKEVNSRIKKFMKSEGEGASYQTSKHFLCQKNWPITIWGLMAR